MQILVCVKQVPDSENELAVDSASGRICFAGQPAYKMNRYDEFAVEEALQISQATGGSTVAAVSVGPPQAADVIRRALGMGADHGILLEHRLEEDPAPSTIAAGIAGLIRRDGYELVLTGALSEDEMNGTVGPMIAAILGWPCATNVVDAALSAKTKTVRVESEIEGGRRELLEISMPAVLTVQSGINQPRYPKLSLLLRANHYPLDIIDIGVMGPPAARERRIKVDYPAGARNSVFLSGSLENKAGELVRILKQKAFLPRQ